MAAIDRIYTSSYKDYKEYQEWAKDHTVTFFDGHKEEVWKWMNNDLKEEQFVRRIPIMTTPMWLDTYLIKYCPIKFVTDRLKQVYTQDNIDLMLLYDFSKIPEGYKKGRSVTVLKNGREVTNIKKVDRKEPWRLQPDDFTFWFNSDTNVWSDQLYPTDTNTAYVKNKTELVKLLKKQYLPDNTKFDLIGRYIGEHYVVIVN